MSGMARAACFGVLLMALPALAGAWPQSIVIFTTDQRPIDVSNVPEGTTVTVYNLDAPRRTEQALTQGLPANLDAARTEVQARLARYTPADVRRIWGARFIAQQVGITKTPAIVFDGITVVYGITQLSQALAFWEDTYAQTTP